MGSNPLQGTMIIKTEHGDFTTVRKDVVAITVVRVRRKSRHHYKSLDVGDLTHIEHRKMPRLFVVVQSNCGGWATPLATYNLNGDKIELIK